MDAGEINLYVTLLTLLLTFVFRKRLLSAVGRIFAQRAVEWARREFLVEDVSEAADGTQRVRIGLSASAKALLAAVTPVLMAEVLKNVKLKPGGPSPLPEGIDLSNLSQALPAILPMLPKKYQGYAALLAPLLGKFLGGVDKGVLNQPGKSGPNPFAKELEE